MIFKFFTRDFPVKKTRASLARAAFRRDFLYNHGGRRSIAGTAQATLPHHPRPTLFPRTFALEPPPPNERADVRGESVVVDSEVRGTTLQKLIVVGEVREYDSSKLIVK